MNTGVAYNQFYNILLNLREIFHGYGRIDDSNAKLDEIIKLILLFYYKSKEQKRFALVDVRKYAKSKYNDETQVAPALRDLFDAACTDKMFINDDGTSIFGATPSLSIQPSESDFAERVITEIEKIDFTNLSHSNSLADFDMINECFGHFIRENFRNNKEDAQYMTPAEIAKPVIDMVFSDMKKDGYFSEDILNNFRIADPTCGVGTLLIESARKYIEYLGTTNSKKHKHIISNFLTNGMFGQDKVDRMVRLSKINTMLLGGDYKNIHIGNSISGKSLLDEYTEQFDFIFTNPPFGAEYEITNISPIIASYLQDFTTSSKNICSEILMLFRCINMLKPNGYLAIVLPDSVFSAKGIYAQIREKIIRDCEIKAIIELPAVTFAQAGTRTKTSVLYLKKMCPSQSSNIIMAVCNDIGYTVKERVGVPVKIATSLDEMSVISKIYMNKKIQNDSGVISSSPSVTSVPINGLIDMIINPTFYNATRLTAIDELLNREMDGFELKSLSDIVNFTTIGRKNMAVNDNTKHISVLHINPDSTIDFQEVLKYRPISKGRQCFAGDIIISKINPRIPRIAVIPQFEKNLVCSNEFEILQAKNTLDAYTICLMLKSSYVSQQIENLTSGTSSSHSRIKREQLSDIKIPCPISKEAVDKMHSIGVIIQSAFEKKYEADILLREQAALLESI